MTKSRLPICYNCKLNNDGDCMASADVVTGNHLDLRQARTDPNQCGPTGRWFQPATEVWREPRDKDGYRTE